MDSSRFRPSSLRTSLLWLVTLAVIPAAALAAYDAHERREVAIQEVMVDNARVLSSVVQELDRLLGSSQQLLRGLSRVPEVQRADAEQCGNILASLAGAGSAYGDLGVARLDGAVVCSALPLPGPVDVSDRLYFRRVVETGGFAVGEYQVGRITGRLGLDVGHPLEGDGGNLTGVLFAALDLEHLGRTTAQAWLPNGSALTMFDPNGKVLLREPASADWVGRDASDKELFQAASTQGTGFGRFRDVDGVARLYAFNTILGGSGNESALLAVGVQPTVAFAQLDAAFLRSLVALAAVAAGAGAVAWAFGERSLLRPLRSLVGATHRLREGDFSARSGVAPRTDELGELAAAFDAMAASLEVLLARGGFLDSSRMRDAEVRVRMEQVAHLNRELASRNQELDEFAHVVSHDLKAPLRAVHHLTEWIEEDLGAELRGETQQNLRQLRASAERMDWMIQGILEYAKAGRTTEAPEDVDTGELVRDVLRDLRPPEGLRVEVGDLPRLHTERLPLRQVFQNLVGNAVAHHDRPAGVVRISGDRAGELPRFAVEDDGPGIPPEFQAKAFRIFQTLGSQRKDSTGVGLAVVKKIVELRGGSVRLHSQGRGARFEFTWRDSPPPGRGGG